MNRRLLNFALPMALTLLAVAVTFTDYGLLRTLFTLPLAFALPGYAMLAAWSPRRLTAFPANILFTLTLSIAAAVVGGLVLNVTPWGLQPTSWVIWLGGVTVFHLVAALLRRNSARFLDDRPPTAFSVQQIAFIVSAVVLSFFALYLARQGALEQPRPTFTQLWLTSATDDSNGIDVGVHNQEGRTLGYRLVLDGDVVQAEREFEIEPGGEWTTTLELPDEHGQSITAYLYRADDPEAVYRMARLSLTDAE